MKALAGIMTALFLVSMLSISVPVKAVDVTLSDAELSAFAYEWGPGALTAITDMPGPGVRFDFTGLSTSSGTGVGDNFPVSALAGGATKDYGSGFVGPYDFSGYSEYVMVFVNVGVNPVTVNIFMNTGWTDAPWGTPAADTYWENLWIGLGAGEAKVVTLDFSNAIAYNAADDPVVAWQVPDGTTTNVKRLDEVSNIGFQILGDGDGSVIVASLVIEKTLDLTEGELGDIVHVTLSVGVPSGLTVAVVDTLPSEWGYIVGTFEVNDISVTPTVSVTPPPPPRSEVISYTLTEAGTYTIEFDAKVTKAYWEDRTVANTATATWYEGETAVYEQTATTTFVIHAFEELTKTATGSSLTIKEKTDVQWTLTFEITNTFSYTMTNVVITDRLGAELEIDLPFPYSITHGTASYTLHGKSKQVHLTWNIGDLLPGETARLVILVSTDLNPGKEPKQSYTMPGIYEMNSGATIKFIDPEQNMQLSAVTAPIYVTVLPLEDS